MRYEIRELRPGEAAEIKRLACPNFSVVEQLFMSKPKLGMVAQAEDGSIAGGAFLVIAEAGGKKVSCVDIMFVLPQHRGSGVARQLYHAAVEALHQRGCETVMAMVRGDNSPSLCRFEAEGLHLTSLAGLRRQIGLAATAALFVKTAALAWGSGCWVLCEKVVPQSSNGSRNYLLRTFLLNGILLLCGAGLASLLHTSGSPWWNLLAALLLLALVTLGETIGRKLAGGVWRFVLPEAGLAPSAIVALLGGFYPLLGHWYLIQRENTPQYRKRMAAPAQGAWLLLVIATLICGVLREIYPFFSCVADLGMMLLICYMLPFYPFDTFAGRRVREYSLKVFGAWVVCSLLTWACMEWGVLSSIALLLRR